MGAEDFYQRAKGKTAKEAFVNAVKEALYDYGHAGYTGSMAEKGEFVMITLPEGKDALEFAEDLVNEDDPRVSDKWGPAGCIQVEKDSFLFFGWASS